MNVVDGASGGDLQSQSIIQCLVTRAIEVNVLLSVTQATLYGNHSFVGNITSERNLRYAVVAHVPFQT